MSPELEKRLCEEFPLLFRLSHLESPDMCCGWQGIRCGAGWYDLIRDLSKRIVEYSERHHLDPMVRNVCRRAGLLEFEVDGADERILAMCGKAREQSSHVCEICGEPGGFSPSPPYDICVSCPKHVFEKDDRPLDPDEISKLRLFNESMYELQREIILEGRRHVEVLSKRVADPLDSLDDFEIEARVTFALRNSHPEYRDEDDNILTSRRYHIPKDIAEMPRFYWNEDWGVGEGHLGLENHSYILHDLCDHDYGPGRQELSPRDILRIGEVRVDIEIAAQMFRKLP